MKKKLIIILVLLLIALAGSIGFYIIGTQPVSKKSEDVIITVKKGETATSVLTDMHDAGLLKSYMASRVYVRLRRPSLKANNYKLNKNMSVSKMFKIMSEGDKDYIIYNELKLVEGETIPILAKKIGTLLNTSDAQIIKKWSDKTYLQTLIDKYWFIDDSILSDDLLYPLEGYLYPETYYIEEAPTIESVTEMMLDKMDDTLSQYKDKITSMNFTPHQFLTLASIVEKETLFDKDLKKIAGVFMNRLNKDMALQSDVTVNYALQRSGVKVSSKMLKTDSKYNTYLHKGLPVGPICAIQNKTIKAVANYKKHNYLYFFAKEDGSVLYSKTYEEHKKVKQENKWY